MAATRWGILSAGIISNDFAYAIKSCDQHEIVAVAARDLEKAKEFGKRFDIPNCYGSYEELSKDPNVEIVYIGTINIYHAEVSMMMMKAGKHVVCEKPMTMNKKQTERVLATAKENKVFFMEGFWTCFFPAAAQLRKELSNGTIGEPRVLTINFGFDLLFQVRSRENALGGGSLLDLGCYGVMFSRMVFKKAKLQRVTASATMSDEGVDELMSATLYFDKGRTAHILTTMTTQLDNQAIIHGSNGKNITVPMFWCPCELVTEAGTQSFPLPPRDPGVILRQSEGFLYEVEAVRKNLLKGERQNALVSHEDSLWIVEVLDEIRRQIGLTFDADKE